MSLSRSSFIIKNDGTLWGCGYNDFDQLGLGDTSHRYTFIQITTNTDDIKSIYCGQYHTLILKNDDTLWGCGKNDYGQLGLGDTNSRNIFTKITDNVKSAYCGSNYTIVLKNNGTLWGCGKNDKGQLGLGEDAGNKTILTKITTNTDSVNSVYCSENHTIISKNDGTLWGCGYNDSGQLGLGDRNNRSTFTQITNNVDNVKSVCCGMNYTFILKSDDTLWGCGYNGFDNLGLGDTSARTTFTRITDNVKSVNCGHYHTIILKNDGALWGCGYSDDGELGLGYTNRQMTLTQISTNTDNIKLIYCGDYYTFILKNDGTLWGCGLNDQGQLGLGNTTKRYTFTQITTNTDDIKCFANNYPNLPSIIKIYNTEIGHVETLDANNFRNIPVNTVERLKSLCTNPPNTYLNCLISFDKKQTWKTFNNSNWLEISDISPGNIILNGMNVGTLNQLDKSKLISGGFIGNLDFKIAMKTNDTSKTPSVTKIYIEYK